MHFCFALSENYSAKRELSTKDNLFFLLRRKKKRLLFSFCCFQPTKNKITSAYDKSRQRKKGHTYQSPSTFLDLPHKDALEETPFC